MDGYNVRRVIEKACEDLGKDKKNWLFLGGAATALYLLNKKGKFDIDSFDARRSLEKIIDTLSGED